MSSQLSHGDAALCTDVVLQLYRLVGTGNAPEAAGLFAEDAIWERPRSGGGAILDGREAIAELLAEEKALGSAYRHAASNIQVSGRSEEAEVVCLLTVLMRGPDDDHTGETWSIETVVFWRHVLRRDGGAWKIAERRKL